MANFIGYALSEIKQSTSRNFAFGSPSRGICPLAGVMSDGFSDTVRPAKADWIIQPPKEDEKGVPRDAHTSGQGFDPSMWLPSLYGLANATTERPPASSTDVPCPETYGSKTGDEPELAERMRPLCRTRVNVAIPIKNSPSPRFRGDWGCFPP
jgi:hypothetical protein